MTGLARSIGAAIAANPSKQPSENIGYLLWPGLQVTYSCAAMPYRDPTLPSSAEEMLARRAQEQAISPLAPTGP